MNKFPLSRIGRWRGRLYATDRARDFDHERDRNVRIRQIYETIDRQPYQWVVVLVAGIGFFLDGYTLFASNIALPMISYVYWHDETSSYKMTCINIATLAGTLFGQVVFGILADKNGRKKMYGVELVLIIAATLGVAMCSTGEHNSMSIFAWLLWWRLLVGVGVGADYPLSAVITSEFAPTKHRARMMASVFFMQPLGQISGNVISLIVVAVSRSQGSTDLMRSIDILWRWVIGLGAVPGLIALFFRLAIPETPRFLLDIEDDPIKAEFDTTQLFGETVELEENSWHGSTSGESHLSRSLDESSARTQIGIASSSPADWSISGSPITTLNSKWTLSRADIHQYFISEGNWRTLFATSICWLLLDFGFYGIGLSSPQFLAKTWGDLNISHSSPVWMTNDDPKADIYSTFIRTSVQALIILNVGSFAGGLTLIVLANQLNRVKLQKYGFLFLAALFIALGTCFITLEKTGPYAIVLYVIGQFAFNFGPNSTTYILPAELYPTRYRASCHGISAGMGKLGSVLVQIFGYYYKFGSSTPGRAGTRRYGTILIVFSVVMLLGAVITHFLVPDVQYRDLDSRGTYKGKLRNRTLESLAGGRKNGGRPFGPSRGSVRQSQP